MEEKEEAQSAFNRAAISKANVSQSLIFFWGGLASFVVSCIFLCRLEGNAHATAVVRAEVGQEAYIYPFFCFITAMSLNILTLLFERDSIKFQLALLTTYINLLAACSDYLHSQGYAPIFQDTWGHPFLILRASMWLHTTPIMVYLLSIISDFNRKEVLTVIVSDILMLAAGITVFCVDDLVTAWFFLVLSCGFFGHVMWSMWSMCESVLREAPTSKRLSLHCMRILMLGTWFIFPTAFFLARTNVLTIVQEEWIMSIGDFLGKVMFSSSLMLGNFMTLEQRRLLAMHAVEEGQRVTVIQELRDLLDQKERFLSSMSHELRTPLNGIIGLSDALLVGSCGDLNDSATKTITTIKTSGSRLLNLINDILDAASMKHGALVIKQEKVNLFNIAQDVVELCQPLAKKGVVLLNTLSENKLPPVCGDTGRIIQILHNLIGNSCKFTHKGSISIMAVCHGGKVEVSVRDTGIGIPAEKHSKIFEAFEQVDASTTRKYGGTGLGLNLVKSLVEAHGGKVLVQSTLGVGTTFLFTLNVWDNACDNSATSLVTLPAGMTPHPGDGPQSDNSMKGVKKRPTMSKLGAADVHHESQEPQPMIDLATISAASESSGAKAANNWAKTKRLKGQKGGDGKATLLSVDDDPINQMVIQSLFVPEGYEVTQAMDGEEALEILQNAERLPDIVLLDVMMPGMSGYQVCQKVRSLYPDSCLPIIMISAKSKEEHIVEGLMAGANDYVVKPFGSQEILARVATHLSFRDAVFSAGEMSGQEDMMDSPDYQESILRHLCSELRVLRCSLPDSVRVKVENSSGKQTHMEIFNQLTTAVARISNLEELSANLSPDALVLMLSDLYAKVHELLDAHSCYMADTMEGRLVVTSGIEGGDPIKNVSDCLHFAEALLQAAASLGSREGVRVEVAIGIHTGAAQAVIVGVQRPVLYLTGNLPITATSLVMMAPANCILVSPQVKECYKQDNKFLEVPDLSVKDKAYLYKAGAWQESSNAVRRNYETFKQDHPFGPLSLCCPRLQPMQMSLMTVAIADPGLMMNALHRTGKRGFPQSLPVADLIDDKQVEKMEKMEKLEKMAHDKDMIEQQLEEVSMEAERLQEEVDNMENQLREAVEKQQAAEADVAKLNETVHQLRQARIDEEGGLVAEVLKELEDAKLLLDKCNQEKEEFDAYVQELHVQLSDQQTQLEGYQLLHQRREHEDLHTTSQSSYRTVVGNLNYNAYLNMGGGWKSASAPLYQNQPSVPPHHMATQMGAQMGLQIGHSQTSGVRRMVLRNSSRQSAITSAEGSVSPSDLELLENRLIARFSTAHCYEGQQQSYSSDMVLVLEELGMSNLLPRFQAEEITLGLLPLLDDQSLKELGVTSVGSRLKLRLAANVILQSELNE